MWGIIPAAGRGTRMQPLGFSKELLPLGGRMAGDTERPLAVSEYLLDRMLIGGAKKICIVISPGKSDILEYFGGSYGGAEIIYAVQPEPSGLCDAVFRAAPLISGDDEVLIGLPDTVWFPATAYRDIPACDLAFILFPVARPELFDAVVLDEPRVREIQVKRSAPDSNWIWGAIKLTGNVFEVLHELWLTRHQDDEYLGSLVNAYLAQGGSASGFKVGTSYCDVGTPSGYRDALQSLKQDQAAQISTWPENCGDSGSAAEGRHPSC
jgi:glucose-1-phosphate thymidylyltransferase